MVRRSSSRKKHKKEEKIVVNEVVGGDKVSEDYCFVCKDGGLLIVCDYKGCVKSYHSDCVGQKEASEDPDAQWICNWHSCLVCKRSPKYQCFCCPNAVCQACHKDVAFARTRGGKGFCHDCLKLALLGEEGVEVDSDGEKVDFKDRETYEGLFKEYWDIIKEQEGLVLEDLHNADIQIKKGENSRRALKARFESQKPESDSDECIKEEEIKEYSSDDHDSDAADVGVGDDASDDAINPVIVTRKKKPKKLPNKRKTSSRIEYVGWGSKSLIEFLASIGVDTSKKLSQDDVASLINKYVHENKLFHPEKRKMVVCDERLWSLLKRKAISVYKINDSLEPHFLDNIDQSEDEGYSSAFEEDNASQPNKKQAWWRNVGSFPHKGSLLEKFQQKDFMLEEPNKPESKVEVVYSCFATIAPQNMKLVYLKKSLIEKLLEQSKTFESKVIGSFVKVKSEPADPKHPYQLLPVTGIKTTSGERNKKTILLEVFTVPNDVPMSMLSNDDVSQEDCEDLHQKVESGLLEKPKVVELEKKAKELHEDITKHAIAMELSILKHRIDLANEKGRRAELYDYRKRRDLLQSEQEQSRLLNELPKVIADVIEVKPGTDEPARNKTTKHVNTLNVLDEKSEESESVIAA